MKCKCRICELSRHVDSVLRDGTKRDLKKLVKLLYDRMAHAEDDLNYKRAILDGSWPQATEILERSLVMAKEIAGRDPERISPQEDVTKEKS